MHLIYTGRNPITKVLDNSLKIIDFELHSHNYIHFWTNTLEKGMNTLIPPVMG